MSELAGIERTLRKAAARRRAERAMHGMWAGLLLGSGAWLALIILYKFVPIPPAIAEYGWIAVFAGALAGLVAGGWRRISLDAAARLIESREALAQRLSTALEVAGRGDHPEWARLVVADAGRAIQGLQPARVLPFGLPRVARWIPLLLVLVVGLGFVPEYRSAAWQRARRDAELVADTGRKLAELVRREIERTDAPPEPMREALVDAGLLADRLSQANLTKADAIRELADAAERLREEAQRLDEQPVLRRIQQAARTPSGQNSGNPALQRQLEKLRETTSGATPEALEKLSEQLAKAQRVAAGTQGQPDASAQQALSEALNQLAQAAADAGLNLAGLQDALDSLHNMRFDRVLGDLALASDELDRLRDMARKLQEMQQNMSELGRTLAEQLQRGQVQAAADTLEAMVEKLRTSGLTPEQERELLKQVSDALDPADAYGEVADLLRAATRKLAASQRSDASQDLAAAADELRKLAQDAQDLQNIAALLEAMDGAKLALMNDRLWRYSQCQGGMCAGCGACNGAIRLGQSGRPGRGVGTWSDNYLYYPEMTERWDNSGVDRPDMDPRGITDRGDARLSPNAVPTKLTGQFTPGPMPAITLKGVSIKGESSVDYTEAVAAAQSDAQSALNQDQVPRAYRGAVRDYFDDLD